LHASAVKSVIIARTVVARLLADLEQAIATFCVLAIEGAGTGIIVVLDEAQVAFLARVELAIPAANERGLAGRARRVGARARVRV